MKLFFVWFSFWLFMNDRFLGKLLNRILVSWRNFIICLNFLIKWLVFNWYLKICSIVCFLSIFVITTFFIMNEIWNIFIFCMMRIVFWKKFKILYFIHQRGFKLSLYKSLCLIFRLLTSTAWWNLNLFKIMTWIKIMLFLFNPFLRRLWWWLIRNLFLTSYVNLSKRKSFIFNSGLHGMIWSKRH